MRAQVKLDEQLTIEEFLAFYEGRPDGERWELIEGVAVLSPTPTDYHQVIVGNVLFSLLTHQHGKAYPWLAMIGVGTRVPISKNSLPQPDLLVKERALTGTALTDDALVLFEVLSRSNTKADQAWRKHVYASVPNCQHYVTIRQSKLGVTRFDRASCWKGIELTSSADGLDLPALGPDVSLKLSDIYRWTPLGSARGE